jgi:predicted secreted hydrolase
VSTIATIAATAYAAIRSQLPQRYVRHNGNAYTGTAAQSLTADLRASRIGEVETGNGAVRLLVSELRPPIMEAPDPIDVSDDGKTWASKRIKLVRTERNGCIVVEYGATYS